MSVQVPSSSAIQRPLKRPRSTKRKHEDISHVVTTSEELLSQTKKIKHSQDRKSPIEIQTNALPDSNSESEIFFIRTVSFYLPVAPISLQSPIAGLCTEHISPLLLTYYPPLRGVVLSYSNPRLSESPWNSSRSQKSGSPILALSIAEYGPNYVWLTADFLILTPSIGSQIEGWVNVQSETHLGLVCWNLFNATIPSERLPHSWKWIEGSEGVDGSKQRRREKLKGRSAVDEDIPEAMFLANGHEEDQGHWVDGQGRKIFGRVAFNVVMIDADGGNDRDGNFVSIVGTALTNEDESKILEQEKQLWDKRHAKKSHSSQKIEDAVLVNGNFEQGTSKSKTSITKE